MKRILVLAMATAALAAPGCGGDDDGEESTGAASTPTTQAEKQPSATTGTGEEKREKTGTEDRSTDDQADTGGGLSRRQYIARADRICTETRAEITGRGRQIGKLAAKLARKKIDSKTYTRKTAELTAGSAQIVSDAIDELEALPKPSDRRAVLERYLALARDQADYLRRQSQAFADEDAGEIQRLNAVTRRTGRRIHRVAVEYGFDSCGGA